MRRKYLNDPTLFLHFCDYPTFEEDLDFIWTNLNSHHARNFVPSLIEIDQMILSNIQM
jgi:hypothetical protein